MKYDDCIGRFTFIDPLFEKYVGWTPYQYSLNNPVNMKDDSGREPLALFLEYGLRVAISPIVAPMVLLTFIPGDTPLDHQMRSEDNYPPPPVPGAKENEDDGKISEGGVTIPVGEPINPDPNKNDKKDERNWKPDNNIKNPYQPK